MIEKIMDKIFNLRDLSESQNSTVKKILLLLSFRILAFVMFPFEAFKTDKFMFVGIVLSWCSTLLWLASLMGR